MGECYTIKGECNAIQGECNTILIAYTKYST